MMKQKRLLFWMLGFLSLVFQATNSFAQELITVKGTVKDKAQKAPLGGVTVTSLSGNGQATAADANGNFEIKVPLNSKLALTMAGYLSTTVQVRSAKLNVEMDVDAKGLEDVVVVGYSKVKKELLTGSVASMKIKEADLEMPTTSVSNLLAGRMAGVNVGTPNGIPGSAAGITIRTGSSFNAQDVLFVIDDKISGQGDFNNLSPNEIDNITVLKDAATTAAYGSRGAGGVVVVTTKRGKAGKPTFSYSFNTGYDKRSKNMPLTSAVDMGEIYNRVYGSVSGATLWTQADFDYFKNNDFGSGYGYGFNMLEDVYRDPFTRTQNLSVSGGSDKVKYFVGGSYVKQQGFLKGLDFKKYNLRANVTANLTNNFELFAGATLNNNLTYSFPSTWIGDASGNYAKLLVWQPYHPVYTKSGKLVDYGWIGNMGGEVNGLGGYSNNNNLKPVFTLSGTYKLPVAGLKAKANFVKSYTNFRSKTFVKHYQLAVVKQKTPYIWGLEDADITGYKFSNQNLADEFLSQTMTWSNDQQLNLQLNYDTSFGRHHVSGMLAYERYEAQGAGMSGSVNKFPFYLNDQWWSTSSNTSDDGISKSQGYSDYLNGRKSWIGQFFYDYAGKYMANFTYRYDGSMQFAPENRWGFFPSGSVGWIVSKENFFNVNGIDNLKLRASAGLVGNDFVGGWQWLQSYNQGNSFLFGNPMDISSGLQYGSIVNRDLTWEKSLNKNIGVDVNFLKHFNATLEYWTTNTYDILGSRNFTKPATFSPTLPAVNYGKMKAQGYDVTLGYDNTFGKVHFNTNLTASYGSAKYVTRDETPTYDWQRLTGRYNTYIAGYTVDKMLRSQAEVDAFMQANPTYKAFGLAPKAGNFVYKDLSGPNGKPDGIIDNWDQSVLKDRNNPLVMGWNFSVEWKGFSLMANFSGRLGQWKSYSDVTGGVEWNRLWKKWATDSWTPENQNAVLPARLWAYNDAQYTMNTQGSNFWYANSSFLRLKFLNLGYSIPRNLYSKLGVQNIRFFASGTNLFLVSKFNTKYYDPELGGGVAFPIIKSFNAGFNVSF